MSQTIISTFENGVNDPNCTPRPTGFDSIYNGWYKSIHFDGSTNVASFFDTVVDTENKLSITASAAHDGTGGLLYTHNSTTPSYGRTLLGTLGYYYTAICDFWVDISDLHVTTGKTTNICRIISINNESNEDPAFDIEVDGDHSDKLKFNYYTKTSWLATPFKTLIGYSNELSSGHHHITIGFDISDIYNTGGYCTIMVDDNVAFRLTDLTNLYAVHSYATFGCIESNDTAPSGTVKFDSIYVNKDIDSSPIPHTLAKKSGNYGAGFFLLNPSAGGDSGALNVSPSKSTLDFSMDINVDRLYPTTVFYGNEENITTIMYAFNSTWDVGFEVDIQYVIDRYKVYAGYFYYNGSIWIYQWTNSYDLTVWKNIGIQWDKAGTMSLLLDREIKETINFTATNFEIEEIEIGVCQVAGDSPYGVIYIDNVVEAEIPIIPPQTITPTYNYFNQMEMPGLVLCNPNRSELYPLGLAYEIKNILRYNALSELEFKYGRVSGSEDIYDAIQGKMVVLIKDIGYYIIESAPEELSGGAPIKTVSCHSLEAELISRRLTGFEGTYEFSDLLNTIVKLSPTWTIGTIDTSLLGVYRTFKSNNSTLYNFIMKDMEKAYLCIFLFNTFDKTISAMANSIPAPDTNIYLSLDNLGSKIEFKEVTEELCTALYCYGGDGLDITGVNPLGTKVIYNFGYFKTTEWMSQGLIDALDDWETLVEAAQPVYADKVTDLNILNADMLDMVAYYDELTAQYQSMITTRNGLLNQDPPGDTTEIDAKIAAQKIKISSAMADIALQQGAIDILQVELRKISNSLAFSQGIVFSNFQKNIDSIGDKIKVLDGEWEQIYTSASGSWPYFDQALMDSKRDDVKDLFGQAETNNDTLLNAIEALFSGVDFTIPNASVLIDLTGYLDAEIVTLNGLFSTLQSIIPNTSVTISIDEIRTKLLAYKEIIYFSANMTEVQYFELTTYIYENTYTNSNIKTYAGATKKKTMENFQTYSQQLYDKSLIVSARVSVPRYEFKGQFSNFLALKEFEPFTNELDLGKAITVGKDNDLSIVAVLLEIEITYDKPNDFNLTFSNSLRLDNSKYIYGDLMGEAAQLGSNLSALSTGSSNVLSEISFLGNSFIDDSFNGGLGNQTSALLDVPILGETSALTISGHQIMVSDSILPQRKGLSFGIGLSVEDDVINNRTVISGAGGGSGHIIVDEGITTLTQRAKLNFVGDGVTASDDGTNNSTIITIPGGGGSITLASDEHGLSLAGTVLDSYLLSTHVGTNSDGFNIWVGDGSGESSHGEIGATYGGANNISFGIDALYHDITGYKNIAIGSSTLHVNTTGHDNVAIGFEALLNSNSHQNIAIGSQSLISDTSGDDNVGVGHLALGHNTEGYSNTAIGTNSLHANIDGNYNIAIGESGLLLNTTGDKNIAMGLAAARANTIANNNIAIGNSALATNTTGDKNTIIGNDAAQDINITGSAGGQNTVIGYNAGRGITTGVNNTMLGANTNVGNVSNSVVVADGAGLVRFYSDATYKGKLTTAITSAKTLTLTSADTYNLTIPRTGTVAMVVISASEPTGLYAGMIWIDT